MKKRVDHIIETKVDFNDAETEHRRRENRKLK